LALDRQTIERRDFPIGRRGYEPEAVDAHLQRLADEIDSLKRAQRPRADSLASTASQQVRTIVEAAESSASEIQRDAEAEARRIVDDANRDAESARSQAIGQAREHVQRVSEATAVMLQRVDAMESELGALLESLRTGANRVNADLTLLQGNMGDLRSTAVPSATSPQAASPGLGGPSGPEPDEEPETEETGAFGAARAEPPAGPADGGADDSEGARLIALNMALNGTPREETDRYLAENFDLPDRAVILDEVYARLEG
jgi:DivIVA domain-containing protein